MKAMSTYIINSRYNRTYIINSRYNRNVGNIISN